MIDLVGQRRILFKKRQDEYATVSIKQPADIYNDEKG
jgi:hypothetical protein